MNKDSTLKKMKGPEVKMTKTARMRLLKANPLIKYQIQKTNDIDTAKNLNLDTVSRMNKSLVSELKPIITNTKEIKVKSLKEETKKSQILKFRKGNLEPSKVKPNNKIQFIDRKVARRSKSAPRRKLNKDVMHTIMENKEEMNKSISVENLPNILGTEYSSQIQLGYKDLAENECPSSLMKSVSNPTPSAPVDLRKRLSDWLEKKHKKPSSFMHLKCFGVRKIDLVEEENKENFETTCINRRGSFEDLRIENPLYSDKDTTLAFAPSDLEKVAKEAVKDLINLISEGYPKEQCEAWLKVIRNRCPQVIEDPQYWECRARIEQLRGDIGSALECYKTAVVQGAEVTSVEQSLDQLLKKFKLLEIDSPADQEKPQKERVQVVQDFKNVFTSMIIKFAIQEKTMKNSAKSKQSDKLDPSNVSTRLLVTPVRRSTRLSRSVYTSTPGTKICSSIQELDPEEKQKMVFMPNAALSQYSTGSSEN